MYPIPFLCAISASLWYIAPITALYMNYPAPRCVATHWQSHRLSPVGAHIYSGQPCSPILPTYLSFPKYPVRVFYFIQLFFCNYSQYDPALLTDLLRPIVLIG